MDRIQTTVETCGAAVATTTTTAAAGVSGTAQAGDADPEIAIATRKAPPGPVALYWHGVPSPAASAAVLSLARALGPALVQRVIEAEGAGCGGADHRLPRSLARAGAEVVRCMGGDRTRVLTSAWHDLVVDDLLRHPEIATVVLASAPAPVVARVVPVVHAARRRVVQLCQPEGAAALAA